MGWGFLFCIFGVFKEIITKKNVETTKAYRRKTFVTTFDVI